jgi:hypothetical protein
MISEKFAREQLARLSRLRNFPNQPEEKQLRNDLTSVLMDAASEGQLEDIIEDWLAESADAPTISQLGAAVRARQAVSAFGCRACNGTGFLLRRESDRDYARPCNCRKGNAA